jgi:hypothetical protein
MAASRSKQIDTGILMSVCRSMVALGTFTVPSTLCGCHPLLLIVAVHASTLAGESFVTWSAAHPGNHVVIARTLASLIPLMLHFSYASLGARCKAEVPCTRWQALN